MSSQLRLTEQELAFFRLTFDLFPSAESPLHYVAQEDLEPEDPEAIFGQLEARELLNEKGSGAAPEIQERLLPVSECSARVVVRIGSAGEGGSRNFYLHERLGVEYQRTDEAHLFGEPLSEEELAEQLAVGFTTTTQIRARPLSMTAGDYLVFAVFARDLRAKPVTEADEDAPMSVDEVLAFFDEPETGPVDAPNDDSWQKSVANLCRDGALIETADGFALHPSLHPVARQIVADRQRTVMRFDFLDEHWLVREVSLYPTDDTVYRLGSEPDGAVVIEELSSEGLDAVLTEVVTTLPNILNPDMQPMLKGSAIHAQGGL